MTLAFYNEIDPKAAAWLRELIKRGVIAPGIVDERDIRDITPNELERFAQVHLFAGIGVWSHALRLAGWPDDRRVWTGSCPCQPFSAAGRGGGFADERHLWPAFHHLVAQCLPPVVFGEQVASKDGLTWLDLVQADLEGAGYAVGAFDLCAAGFGAPHIRQRLYFVADRAGQRRPVEPGQTGALHGAGEEQPERRSGHLVYPECTGLEGHAGNGDDTGGWTQQDRPVASPGRVNGFWANADWVWCRDERYRPIEPGTFPMVDGASARLGRLRGYGNAIVAPQAAEFIKAYMEVSQ